MNKAKITFIKNIFGRGLLILAGVFLLLLCIAPFLRDMDTLQSHLQAQFVSAPDLQESGSSEQGAESSGAQKVDSDEGARNIDSSEIKSEEGAGIGFENGANAVDNAFKSFLHVVVFAFSDLSLDASKNAESTTQENAPDSAIQNTQESSLAESSALDSADAYSLPQEAQALIEQIDYNYDQISQATYDTLYMVFFAIIIAVILGLPLGIALSITKKGRICANPTLNAALGSLANIVRSFPFIILIILLLPLSRILVGTSIGATAAIIPLAIAAIPFIARLFEGALEEIDKGLIEATLSMGASKMRVVRMMIAEAKPGIINAITITIIGLIGYSAMGGAVGAGGLGDVAIRLGFQSYQNDILINISLVIIILVQFVQSIGDMLVAKARKMR